MKHIQKRLGSLFMAAVMMLSMAATPVMAAEKKDPPTVVKSCTTASSSIKYSRVTMEFEDSTWVNAISAVEIDGENYSKSGFSNPSSGKKYFAGKYSDPYGSGHIYILQVNLPKDTESVKCVISANDHEDLTINLEKSGNQYTAAIVQDSPGGSGGESEAPGTPENSTVDLSKVSFATSFDGNDWQVSFGEAGYADKISGVSVNGATWEAASLLTRGGQYKIDDGKLLFARKSYGAAPALKSGDSITTTATGYNDLTFKLIIDLDGNASAAADDGMGDPYALHVKIEGSFEAAIVGQKDYDGVSSASVGGASSNKNSAVTVYGALTEKRNTPADDDWIPLGHQSKLRLNGSKSSVRIVPDTEKGTGADADSGMKGVYMTFSSDLTLNGTPKDPGSYLISVHIEDDQGRSADSNALPFRIYTGEETLADRLKTEHLRRYSNGLYAWDIMEPWAIKNFGSNVGGEENSVRVPEKLEVWFGSHESGTYGVLGYDIAWDDVKADSIPQTLYIPNGCDLTLLNMKILSSVRIVVESGGKLTLRDSTVQGIIDVQSGGTFSMNYNAYNKKFETGASLCGQLRLADGAILENAAIYSHTNYLSNGKLTDRSNDDAVVTANGNVTVKGQVFIRGDEAGSTMRGQTALEVNNGTLTLADDAILVTYGGGGTVTLYSSGGSAVKLNGGKIAGKGKLAAIGGRVLFGSGDEAVAGTGSIDVSEVFLQGATAYEHKKGAQPGKAHAASVTVKAPKQHIADGTLVNGAANDPLEGLYWKAGIDATPDLTKFVTEEKQAPAAPKTQAGESGSASPGTSPRANANSGANGSGNAGTNTGRTNFGGAGSTENKRSADSGRTKNTGNKGNAGFGRSGGANGSSTVTGAEENAAAPKAEGTTAPRFADVRPNAYYAAAVQWAAKQGVTAGVSETEFAPDGGCTRAQIVTFLWRAAGTPEPKSTTGFSGVPADSYYAKAVAWAAENGITTGTGDGGFSPDAACTRAQAVTFLFRALGGPADSNAVFGDVSPSAWYAEAVAWAAANDVTTGIGGGLFGSDHDCTRGQIVTFLWRCMK